jgi:phage tail-like protein
MERSPGRIDYQTITLEAGKTNDESFEQWANELITTEARPQRVTPPNFRRDVTIEVRDIDGTPALKYLLHKAWVTKYTAISDLAGDGNDTIIETLEITHEGFDRQPVAAGGGEGEGEAEEAEA